MNISALKYTEALSFIFSDARLNQFIGFYMYVYAHKATLSFVYVILKHQSIEYLYGCSAHNLKYVGRGFNKTCSSYIKCYTSIKNWLLCVVLPVISVCASCCYLKAMDKCLV